MKREQLYDIVKAVAILLVVLSHALPHSDFPPWVSNFIVGMNMPVFFLISGYFCWKTVETGDVARLARHVKSYLLPGIWISQAFAFVSPLFGLGEWNLVGLAYKGIKGFVFGPWFIWALAVCYALAFLMGRVSKGGWRLFALMGIAETGLLFMPGCGGIIYKGYECAMFPYFVLGGALWHYGLKPWENRWIGLGCLAAFLAYVALLPVPCREVGMSFYFNETSWRGFLTVRGAVCMFARPAVGVAGSFGVMWLIGVISKSAGNVFGLEWLWNLVAKLGTCTLGIYLLHQWILARIVQYWPGAFKSQAGVLGVVVALTLLCFAITWLTQERIPWTRKWVWGKS